MAISARHTLDRNSAVVVGLVLLLIFTTRSLARSVQCSECVRSPNDLAGRDYGVGACVVSRIATPASMARLRCGFFSRSRRWSLPFF